MAGRTNQLELGEQSSTRFDATSRTFEVILADPPWRYQHSRSRSRAVERHYPTLSFEEITRLPVQRLATKNSLLFLWATAPLLKLGLGVLEAWGFTYVTNAVWNKVALGMGYHFRQQHELLLIGRRGTPGSPPPDARIRSVITAKRTRHSSKPPHFHHYIERAYPHARKLELFARQPRSGWSVWGNEVDSDISLAIPVNDSLLQQTLPLET